MSSPEVEPTSRADSRRDLGGGDEGAWGEVWDSCGDPPHREHLVVTLLLFISLLSLLLLDERGSFIGLGRRQAQLATIIAAPRENPSVLGQGKGVSLATRHLNHLHDANEGVDLSRELREPEWVNAIAELPVTVAPPGPYVTVFTDEGAARRKRQSRSVRGDDLGGRGIISTDLCSSPPEIEMALMPIVWVIMTGRSIFFLPCCMEIPHWPLSLLPHARTHPPTRAMSECSAPHATMATGSASLILSRVIPVLPCAIMASCPPSASDSSSPSTSKSQRAFLRDGGSLLSKAPRVGGRGMTLASGRGSLETRVVTEGSITGNQGGLDLSNTIGSHP